MIGLCHKCFASGVSIILDEDAARTVCTDCHNRMSAGADRPGGTEEFK